MIPKCVVCSTTKNLQTHHISYEPEITQILCVDCHLKIHNHGVGMPKLVYEFSSIRTHAIIIKTGELSTTVRKVFKLGESIAITFPKDYIDAHKIKAGDDMEILFNGELHLKPVKPEEIKKYFEKMEKEGKK